MMKQKSNYLQVIIIEKYSTWAFGLLSKHTEIYEDKDYPKYYPNTMFPEYACVTHAKCEVCD